MGSTLQALLRSPECHIPGCLLFEGLLLHLQGESCARIDLGLLSIGVSWVITHLQLPRGKQERLGAYAEEVR
ncbi:hypothetical protein E3T54_05145 [Cryobacterium sp. Sr8]|uniref:hypothetical protein n=1 Tax=Cryobacterium sp. Sr8 TaxID=1259203 RepID=UPI00106B8EA6|nr:hypothetical protein [Cryobacterium sp. Sr8]TFD79496.1 hypothetical protein E3T54_05145 [Cryobacterium sp. Sr8]